jgi:PAS domain-containing protein
MGARTGTSELDRILAAIEAIHAAGLDASSWPTALGAMTGVVGGIGTALEIIDKATGRHRALHQFGLPRASELAYVEHYVGLSPRIPHAMPARPGTLIWDYQILDEAHIARSPFYMDFLAGADCRYFVAGIVANTADEFVGIGVQRTAKQGHGGRTEIERLKRLLPHLQQAHDVARRLSGASDTGRSIEQALECLADGVALVGRDGAVVFANEAAQAIARRRDGIGLRRGRIDFAAVDARERFAAALAGVLRPDGSLSADGRDFPVPRPGGAPPYAVSVRPLVGGERHLADPEPAAIVFLRDPRGRHSTAIDTLREILGLTEAEAALALALQAGASPADHAATRGLSLNTVYTHLRRLREKTGCTRMPELIRKLDDLQVPLRPA